ncbi:hypothetical protein OpiT1DRAFT_05306 [Opitutaceae bacterium TAV1]|nr:hypothetical protein OpiT1DRAFT_05306 [Opitutaceae bacterium TAV1]
MAAPGIIQIAEFFRRHGAAPRGWPVRVLVPWLRWHWRNGGVCVVRAGGRIVAAGVGRCVDSPAEADADLYRHNEYGAILWVDELASRHPRGLSLLLTLARRRFGPRLAVCGHVFMRPGRLRMLPWKTVEKLRDHA